MRQIEPPILLKSTQEWFGSIIARPIDENNKMNPTSPSGQPMKEEAKEYILPSLTLKPHQRIEIYNQQYWWRLLSILHENFPLVVRLFGYFDFNQRIGFPYLCAYPPHTWSLNPLGYKIVQWLEDHYHEKDKALVIHAAQVDEAYNDSFLEATYPPLSLETLPTPNDINSILNKPLTLQPSVTLYKMDYHLFPFRTEMLEQEPEYWEEHDFPELVKENKVCTILYQNASNNMCWKEIHPAEYYLLTLFQKGTTIEQACDSLEEQDQKIVDDAIENLSEWFQKWVIRGLLISNTLE
ncbi:MAG: hypothetical protein K940chlam3_01753 [Chlamydiae bacterium]|nr:hypothetical protein [Chlamydiota bacterium]